MAKGKEQKKILRRQGIPQHRRRREERVELSKESKDFAQGDAADSVFYVQDGQVKLSVISELGKEAVVALHGKEDFFGEGCLSGQSLRLATAAAMTDCVIMRLDKAAVVRVLREKPKFSEMFLSYILARNARVEADRPRSRSASIWAPDLLDR